MPNLDKARVDPGVYLFALIASVSISIWSVFADPIINNDGILYIQAAEALSRGDVEAALSLHKWPFYPFLISLVQQITGLDTIISAHILNGLFNTLSCIIFILLIAEFGGERRTVLIASLVIVFFPGLNELRSFVIRDHGYIVFYLSSFYFLLRAMHARDKRLLLGSLVFMGVATLFRIEGFVFLIVIPLIYFYSRIDAKPVNRLHLAFVAVIIAILLIPVFGWWLFNPGEGSGYATISIENIKNGWTQANEFLKFKIETLKKIVNTSSSNIGRLVFLWTVTGVLLAQILIILSIPYAVLAGYAVKKNLIFPTSIAVKPWRLFIYCNLGILVLFTLTWLFLTDRYPLALVMMLLITVPFALDHIYAKWKDNKNRTVVLNSGYLLLALVLILNCMEGFTSYSDKHYLRDSGVWMKNNIHRKTKLLTNQRLVGFYSGLPTNRVTVMEDQDKLLVSFYKGQWIEYDYLALQVNPDPEFASHLKTTLWVKPEKIIADQRGNEVRMYNIKKYRERRSQ
jgi:hypothetical protein